MPSKISTHYFTTALKNPDIRLWIGSVGSFTLGSRALAVGSRTRPTPLLKPRWYPKP